MNTKTPKKNVVMYILEILKNYTDFNHRLTQNEIIDILKNEYCMIIERKAVSRNITNLQEIGYDIEHDNGYYIENREFEDSELRLLIDSLLFSKHIPYSQCKTLIQKIEGLSNNYFKARVKHICNMQENMPENKQLFYTIEVLDEAISQNKQVSFTYNIYKTDKKLHPKREKPYTVHPYQIVATNGRYYLICSTSYYGNVSHYRLDHILDIQLLDAPADPMNKIHGLKNGLNLQGHMAEHIYMFSGESAYVKFRANKCIVDQIIDWFGKDIKFSNETEDECDVSVKVNERAMFYWALQYGLSVEVLEPMSLRERLKEAIEKMNEKYHK